MPAPDLAEKLLARNRDAVSPALNLVDDARPQAIEAARALLDQLETADSQRALQIGITGAPGAGKSTLIDGMVRQLRARDQSVGIIAVDPSSRRTGGALLGDRVRMRSGTSDPGVFLRSMAARRRLGGLADATRAGVQILSAVFDWVIVETVGVGQSETDIAQQAHTLVFVAQPAAGDTLQFIKAGILELPDVFIVNKADLGAVAERSAAELEASLGLGAARADGWTPPVLLTSARDGIGIAEVLEKIEAHRRHLETAGELATRRRRSRSAHLLESLESRYGSYGIEALGGFEALAKRVEASGETTASLLAELAAEVERCLRKP